MLPRDVKTNEYVHISVRDRGYEATRGPKDILPGLKYVNCINDGGSWNSQGSWSSEESRSGNAQLQIVLREAPLDPFEVALQGFSLPR